MNDQDSEELFQVVSQYFCDIFIYKMYDVAVNYADVGVKERYLDRVRIYSSAVKQKSTCYNQVITSLFEYMKKHQELCITTFDSFVLTLTRSFVPESIVHTLNREQANGIIGIAINALISSQATFVSTKDSIDKIIVNRETCLRAISQTFILDSIEVLKAKRQMFYHKFTVVANDDNMSTANEAAVYRSQLIKLKTVIDELKRQCESLRVQSDEQKTKILALQEMLAEKDRREMSLTEKINLLEAAPRRKPPQRYVQPPPPPEPIAREESDHGREEPVDAPPMTHISIPAQSIYQDAFEVADLGLAIDDD